MSLRQQSILAGIADQIPALRPRTLLWLLPPEGNDPPAFLGGKQLSPAIGFLYADFSLKATLCRPDGKEERRSRWVREQCEFGPHEMSVFHNGQLVGRWRYSDVICLSATGGRVTIEAQLPTETALAGAAYAPHALILASQPPPKRRPRPSVPPEGKLRASST